MNAQRLTLMCAWAACAVLLFSGAAHAQFRGQWGSYQACGNTSCQMCYGATDQYTGASRSYNYSPQLYEIESPEFDPGQAPRPKANPAPPLPTGGADPAAVAPTPQKVVEAALALASLTPHDIIYDLGCGDGRVLKTAWKQWGTRGVGIEIDKKNAQNAIANCKGLPITIVNRDARKTNLQDATVVYMFLYDSLMAELVPKMRSARLIISHNHPIPGLDNRKIPIDGSVIYLAKPNSRKTVVGGGLKWEVFNRRK